MARYYNGHRLDATDWKLVEQGKTPLPSPIENNDFYVIHSDTFFKVVGDTLYVKGSASISGNYGYYLNATYKLGDLPTELSGNWSSSPTVVGSGTHAMSDQQKDVYTTASYRIENNVFKCMLNQKTGLESEILIGFNLQFTKQ